MSVEFETKIVLSGILKYGHEGYAQCCDLLDEDCFDNLYDQLLFSAFKELALDNKEYSISAVLSKCSSFGINEDHFEYFKESLNHECESIRLLRDFAHKIYINKRKELTLNSHRKCIDQIEELNNEISEDEIYSISENSFVDLVQNNEKNQKAFGDKVSDLIDEYAANPTQSIGLPLPWPDVNKSIGNGMRSGVTLIGARSGVGKTSIGIMSAVHMARQGIPTLILDTEMTYQDIGPRFLANMSDIPISEIETGKFAKDDFKNMLVRNSQEEIRKLPITHKEVAGKAFSEILSSIRRWLYTTVGFDEQGNANQCYVIYDYFKLMSAQDISNNVNESQAMGFQISSLTDFCKKYNVPCLSFVQLNRTGIEKEDTSTIFGSDKLLHLCNSFSIFKHKTKDEIIADGFENGNRKWCTLKSRYGGEHSPFEYVSMTAGLDRCILLENGTIKKGYGKIEEKQPEKDVEL